jgi:hypothetical protein
MFATEKIAHTSLHAIMIAGRRMSFVFAEPMWRFRGDMTRMGRIVVLFFVYFFSLQFVALRCFEASEKKNLGEENNLHEVYPRKQEECKIGPRSGR